MAYVPGVKNDIFISYAHVDNEPDIQGVRWVSEFVRGLKLQVLQRLGGPRDFKVFFDESDLEAHHQLQYLLENVRDTAVFVAILSPTYVAHDWTMQELRAFKEIVGDSPRIIVVEKLPLESPEEYPAEIRSNKRTQFWRRNEPESHAPSTLTTAGTDSSYRERLEKLADQVRRLIRDMRTPPPPPRPPHRGDPIDGGTTDRKGDFRARIDAHPEAERIYVGIGGVVACWAIVLVLIWMDLNSGGWIVLILLLLGLSVATMIKTLPLIMSNASGDKGPP